ncbi:MAG: hypothetical protein NVSMB1_07780 [Polyangiales bacterium]
MTKAWTGSLHAALLVLLATWMLLFARDASAHAIGASSGTYRIDAGRLVAELTLARREMVGVVKALAPKGDFVIADHDLIMQRSEIERRIVSRIVVDGDGAPCPGALDEVALTEEDGVFLKAHWLCKREATHITVRLEVLDDLSHGHRHFATIINGINGATGNNGNNGTAESHPVFYREFNRFEISATPNLAANAAPTGSWTLFRMGLEHILKLNESYDHILFLYGLILVGGRLRSLAFVVTSFTLGHSISLALASLDVWSPPSRFVEPAIALSIAYVGLENFFVANAEKRWRITFPFGLIHGFGFASALREINLPRAEIPKALVLFNLGVEGGQLIVLAALLPLVMLARRFPAFDKVAVRVASVGIIVAGLILFGLRLRA